MQKMLGFTLLAALFTLIIFSLVSVFIISISTPSPTMVNAPLLKTHAREAAKSALALAEQQWLNQPRACPLWTIHFDKTAGALAGFDVDITCPTVYAFPKIEPVYYAIQLKAVATKGTFPEKAFVSQTVERWLVLDDSVAEELLIH